MAHGDQRDLGERLRGIDIVIPSGSTTHTVSIVPRGLVLVAVETPAALTSVSMTFTQCQTADGTYIPIYSDAGSAYSVTVAASRHILIDPAKLVGVSHLKVVMGSAEADDRTLILNLRRID
jgi:hypothetical protein